MEKRTLPECIRRVIDQILVDLDSPQARNVQALIGRGEWDTVLRLKTDPARYSCARDYLLDAAATDLLRKCLDMPGSDPKAREAVAVSAFYAAEKQCKVTNDRFELYLNNGPFEDPDEVRIANYLQRVKTFIARVLGPIPRDLLGRHGPGATFGDKGERTTIPDKMSSRPTITQAARDFLVPFWTGTAWFRSLAEYQPDHSDPLTVRGNRFTTVDKDALKDRGICIEPSLNVFWQLAVGKEIRRRLRRVCIDLDEGQTQHRQVAKLASQLRHLITVDLSSASDTVAYKLVKYLLPAEWFELLTALRSPFSLIKVEGKDRYVYLEKFSSMGNGFTFELETLIFLGLTVVATELSGVAPEIGKNILVYGDDIIAPTEASRELLAMLRFCGFTPNVDKTFTTGVFRESCGGDFFDGWAVRPHFMKEFPNEPQQWIALANGIHRLQGQLLNLGCDAAILRRAWFRTLDNIPGNIRLLRGPSYLGDAVIHDDDETKWSTKVEHQVTYFRGYVPVPKKIPLNRWDGGTQLASALYGVPSDGPTPRKRGADVVSGYRISWLGYPSLRVQQSGAYKVAGAAPITKWVWTGVKPRQGLCLSLLSLEPPLA